MSNIHLFVDFTHASCSIVGLQMEILYPPFPLSSHL